MKFYDVMTLVWAGLWGGAAGYATFHLATNDLRAAWTLGTIACVGMALAVVFWRMFKGPGK